MDNSGADEEVELCINCGKETQYKQSDHIDNRMGYIEGSGQLCSRCNYNKIFIKNEKNG
jgi:DNA-directed RNA polymerase subunit RPC12/RpoP|tara:strand:+ start:252 stop:428 length:177 start_codon:yes stop_codon:yes gene_type:complete